MVLQVHFLLSCLLLLSVADDFALTMSGVLSLRGPLTSLSRGAQNTFHRNAKIREEIAGLEPGRAASFLTGSCVEILVGSRVLSDMLTTLRVRVC